MTSRKTAGKSRVGTEGDADYAAIVLFCVRYRRGLRPER
jgi:hypothetical protein